MQTISRYTSWKVISGYVLLFLLSILGAILIYKQITQFIYKDEQNGSSAQRLFFIGNILTGLYESEAVSNAFVQTGSRNYFQKYLNILEETEANIRSLKSLTIQEEQQLRIDTIRLLLEKKVRNLQELVQVKQSLAPDNFYSKAIASIEARRDSALDKINIRKRFVTTIDSSYIKSEKKRRWLFFKAKPDSVLKISQSQHTIIDTLPEQSNTQNTDSIVHVLKSAWEDLQRQTQDITSQINRKEYALIRQSTYITDQLKRILGEYEKEEIYHTQKKQESRERTISILTRIFAWIAAITLLFTIFFIIFILRDLSRSQRYRKQLEEANHYRDQLLKSREKLILTVTHDIKSPLSSILGYIELLHGTNPDKRQVYFLENMKGSSQHILNLITNLLDYSRLENNKMILEAVTFNPFQVFQETCDSFLPLALSKELSLSCHIDSHLNRDFTGDALRIRQVLVNILSNAIKYTSSGSISFEALLQEETQETIVRIKDTGSGMTKEEQKMIFEEFTRLSSNASNAEGTGLGLTITLKLVELLKGNLLLESEPGEGSCFTITLPLQAAPSTNSQKNVPSIPKTAFENLKILLVDDDSLQLEMTAALLNRQGIQTETTHSPKEVCDKLQSASYDMLFTDIQMPEMNGFELVRQIRSLPLFQNLPVVALSADAEKTEEDYLRAGFTAYLGKPFTSSQVIQLLSRLTDKTIVQSCSDSSPKEDDTSSGKGYTLKNVRLFTDNDAEATAQIISSFCTETEKHIQSLHSFASEGRWEEISRLAHKMLPMFRQLEAQTETALLEKLEHAATPFSEKEITEQVKRIVTLSHILLEKLRKE